jgi:hypothetical protein
MSDPSATAQNHASGSVGASVAGDLNAWFVRTIAEVQVRTDKGGGEILAQLLIADYPPSVRLAADDGQHQPLDDR